MKKKTIGWIFLALALFFFSPIPGPDDVIGLKLYSMYSGVDVSFNNLSEIYLDYTIFTMFISFIFLILAMNYLNWSWKRLWKRLDIGKYKIAVGLAILAVLAVAIFEIEFFFIYFLPPFICILSILLKISLYVSRGYFFFLFKNSIIFKSILTALVTIETRVT